MGSLDLGLLINLCDFSSNPGGETLSKWLSCIQFRSLHSLEHNWSCL